MSSIRPLTELRSYWRDCGRGDWNLRFSRSGNPPADLNISNSQKSVLRRTIEEKIIPRLLLSHGEVGTLPDHVLGVRSSLTTEDVEKFVNLLLARDILEVSAFLTDVRARGVPLGAVFLELFSPSARYLGELWERDICDFADVTIALSRLQQLLRTCSSDFEDEAVSVVNAPRAFLAVAPGDQHTFGLFVVREFFRRAGWRVCGGVYDTKDELLSLASSEPFDVLALSVGRDAAIGDLASLVRSMKRRASNPAAIVMVGGRFILEHPELVTRIGADATAADGRGAVPSFPTCLT